MQFWNELEGQQIDGLYPLRRLVRSEGRSAWFETETQDTPATISLTEALTDADVVSARLEAAQHLKHPNLVSILKVGQVRLDNTLLVYAVMEHIEQSLSDVLQSQALSPEEGREVAEALVSALTAIHQNGMSHGHVEAASVLATQETVKLRSDCLHTNTGAQAEDVAGIGTTLFHVFTQRKALSATDAQINRIPAPFAEIVRNSFARRWTLAQISNALKPVLPVASPMPAAPVAVNPPPEPVAVAPVPAKTPPIAERLVTPPIPMANAFPAESEEEAEPVVSRRTPFALYGAAAVVVLAIIGWLLLRPHPAAPPVNAPPPQTQAAAPVVTEPQKPSAATPVPSTPAPAGRAIWRVVAYTYRSQTKASDMVARISGKHADLGAAIFSPPKRSGIYLVTVGGAMDHNAAVKMLDKARRMGLPADSYVQNFAE